MTKVFVTDALFKHSLAIIRAISNQYAVDCGYTRAYALSFFSSRIHGKLLYPDPRFYPQEFAEAMVRLARKMDYAAILPVSYESCVSMVRFAPDFDRVMLPNAKSMEVASNKRLTTELARELSIPTPDTLPVSNIGGLEAAARVFRFPFFLKNSLGSQENTVIGSESELRLRGPHSLSQWGSDLIAQEVAVGEGCGFFALFNRGSLRAFFMHRRIREGSPNGGPSTCCESFYDPKLKEYGVRILQALNWHGAAMVEFKRTKENEYKLLEINPKFWGSLDIAIAAGVNFPQLIIECITSGDCNEVSQYAENLRYQWPIPDDFARLGWGASGTRAMLGDLFNPKVKKNLTIHDPGPALIQLLELGYLFARNVRTRTQTARWKPE